ncbi:rho guanine nucleotide exchange factor 15 [Triplophysa rosa]|uniref:Rho guanine nucleotide exchange factor 15 n=1 Tax=Triplophysa rosa TaxID=992332 RepID=A0A9W7WGH1_TRIRA|nr:rho guanine nucleotide exchange factor 15 [Triplophysa rosa]XP_057215219.1 rho guanine nucleotide exchange factor 15 [Triplophysa rosa]KAI7796743.1 putative rho guanine nucleotide exchange factor 15 [Triplophysa rosa]
MSSPEAPQLPPKPEVKQRPPVPTKPSNNTTDTSPAENTTSPNSGNVKKIVNIFSQPESKTPSGGTAKVTTLDRKQPKPPIVKPRRKTKSFSQTGADSAPPLPPKTRQNHSGQKEEVESKEATEGSKQDGGLAAGNTDGGRSDPDGKESGKRRGDQDSSPLPEPQCEKNCGCVCHLQRPGMKLVWVPISEKDDEEGEDDGIGPDPEIETCDTEDLNGKEEEQDDPNMKVEFLSESVDKAENNSEEPLTIKDKFQETRNFIEQQLRRKSDPGPHSVIASVVPFPQTPLNVPKAQSLEEPEEESIYQSSLDVCPLSSQNTPPAIPPRMPLDNRCSPARLILPKPLTRPASPLLPLIKCSPPASPPPQKPPPPTRNNENGRRPSSYSLQSMDETDSGGADGGKSNDLKRQRGLPRRKQSDDSEALYQFYTKTYISKEIRRTVCRNISKTSIDFQMDSLNTANSEKGAESARSSPVPTTKQTSLWQDLPEVQDSGVLETLTPEQRKYQESMFEVIASERSYLRSLCVLVEHFMESSDLSNTLIIMDKKTLFSNILRIKEVSERFLKDLEERLDESIIISDICDIIHYHAQHNFPAYIDYVRNQIYQEKIYTTLMQSNTQFAAVITRLQESPECQRLPFMSFMLLPFQRITRIKMLIENILKKTDVGTDEEQTASKALDSVSKIIEECNTQVGKMKQVEELIEINKILEFDKLKAVPIISQTRYLEKRGDFQEVNRGATFLTLRSKFTSVYLFLFNDLLVFAKKSSERYVVQDHAHRSLVQVQSMGEDASVPSLENCFCLTLLENHQGRHVERVLKAPTQSDLHRWLAAFPNPNDPNKDQEEVIYEDWDCPQVQCVEQYVAIQADELNLEPTEIVNVIRKTNEGWYEGICLSDGQKGWFPVANVLEITNEHVRRRNLRERYRVMQAASVVNKTRTLPKGATS